MKFAEFARSLQALEGTASRLTMTSLLAELFAKLTPAEVEKASYLLQGQLGPAYEAIEFQLSVKMVIRALARLQNDATATATSDNVNLFGESEQPSSETEVTKLYKEYGDLGTVAETVLTAAHDSNKTSTQTLLDVYEQLRAIAETSGEGSQEKKLA
jgi:DNA ligase 1